MRRGTEEGDGRLMGNRNLNEKWRSTARTPRRHRVIEAFQGGHVLQCGRALPL